MSDQDFNKKLFVDKVIKTLDLNSSTRRNKVEAFLDSVSFHKLVPYINLVKDNPEIPKQLKTKYTHVKDSWDAVVELYRYNIKLSALIYPYVYLLETALKTKINNLFCEKFQEMIEKEGFKYNFYEWHKSEEFQGLFMSHFDEAEKQVLKDFEYDQYSFTNKSNAVYNYYCLKFPEDPLLEGKAEPWLYAKNWYDSKQKELLNYCDLHEKLFKHKDKTLTALVEGSTLGLWVNLTLSSVFWEEKRNLFARGKTPWDKVNKKDLRLKLILINNLRNYISHHRQIIGKNAFNVFGRGYSLKEAHRLMIEVFDMLGYFDLEYMLGDISCVKHENCSLREFQSLYDELNFVHEYEIKAKKQLGQKIV